MSPSPRSGRCSASWTTSSGSTTPPPRRSGSSRAGCWPSRWRSCSPCASRAASAGWRACRSCALRGLDEADARALLETVVPGPIDERVRDRIVAETRGNPLALLELPRGMSAAELAGGFAAPGPVGLSGSIEDGFRRRLDALPADTRRLLQLAAADPVGEPLLAVASGRAARDRSGGRDAGGRGGPARDRRAGSLPSPAGALGGVSLGVRRPSARALHAALAEATDAELDPDRRAWHRAQAAPGPDEAVADGAGALGRPARRRAEASRRPRPSSRARRRSRPTPPIACAACSRRRGPSATPARSRRRCELLTAAEAGPVVGAAGRRGRAPAGRGRVRSTPRRRRRAAARRRGPALGAARPRAGARDAPRGARRGDLGRGPGQPGRAGRGGRSRPRRAARARPARRGGRRARRARAPADGGLRGGRAGAGARAGDRAGAGGPRRRSRSLALADRRCGRPG